MITTPEQYNAHLVALQNRNFPSKTPPFAVMPQALLGDKEKIYYIDLNQRLIHSPEFIGVLFNIQMQIKRQGFMPFLFTI